MMVSLLTQICAARSQRVNILRPEQNCWNLFANDQLPICVSVGLGNGLVPIDNHQAFNLNQCWQKPLTLYGVSNPSYSNEILYKHLLCNTLFTHNKFIHAPCAMCPNSIVFVSPSSSCNRTKWTWRSCKICGNHNITWLESRVHLV